MKPEEPILEGITRKLRLSKNLTVNDISREIVVEQDRLNNRNVKQRRKHQDALLFLRAYFAGLSRRDASYRPSGWEIDNALASAREVFK